MAERCPRCRVRLQNPRALACPSCGYSLRLPAVGKLGGFLMVAGFFVLLFAIFSQEMWIEALAAGIGAIVLGMGAFVAAGWMMGRSRRA